MASGNDNAGFVLLCFRLGFARAAAGVVGVELKGDKGKKKAKQATIYM